MKDNGFWLHLLAGAVCGRDKTCGQKRQFPTEELAELAARHHNNWPNKLHDVEAYPCFYCGYWHLGGTMPLDQLQQIAAERFEVL